MEGLATMGGDATTMALCLHPWSEAAVSHQSTDPCYLEGRVLFVHPGSHKLCSRCSRNTCTAACCVASGEAWVATTVLRAEINQNQPQFANQVSPLEAASLQHTPEFQNGYIRQISPVQWSFRWGGRFLVLPTLPLSQNSPPCLLINWLSPW